jgi:hypothetical protein
MTQRLDAPQQRSLWPDAVPEPPAGHESAPERTCDLCGGLVEVRPARGRRPAETYCPDCRCHRWIPKPKGANP